MDQGDGSMGNIEGLCFDSQNPGEKNHWDSFLCLLPQCWQLETRISWGEEMGDEVAYWPTSLCETEFQVQ